MADGCVVVEGERISAVVAPADVPTGVPTIDTEGIILPGLVDLHNHVTWNAFPRWKPQELTRNRYEWLTMPLYKMALDTPHAAIQRTNACDLERYGEVKAIVGGATAITGSLGPTAKDPNANACDEGLARNLDYASGLFGPGVNHEPLLYKIFPFELDAAGEASVRSALAAGKPVIVHLAEGADASAAREFKMLKAHEFLKPGLTVIHGVALGSDEFREMKSAGVALVWSPRSNFELYGTTTAIRDAKAAGVSIALSPDWSPSGSDGMLQELAYAARWNAGQSSPVFSDKEFVDAVTATPAQLANVADKIGRIAPGSYADFLIVRRPAAIDPYTAVVRTSPSDVKLVVIGGRPIYGQADLARAVNPSGRFESLSVCNMPRVIDMSDSDGGKGVTWKETVDSLRSQFGANGVTLSPLVDCRAMN